jgi:hypothetical protein
MTTQLTNTQEAFLSDLSHSNTIIMSMDLLQKKYSTIASKSQIKRDIDILVNDGMVERKIVRCVVRGKIISKTIYKNLDISKTISTFTK